MRQFFSAINRHKVIFSLTAGTSFCLFEYRKNRSTIVGLFDWSVVAVTACAGNKPSTTEPLLDGIPSANTTVLYRSFALLTALRALSLTGSALATRTAAEESIVARQGPDASDAQARLIDVLYPRLDLLSLVLQRVSSSIPPTPLTLRELAIEAVVAETVEALSEAIVGAGWSPGVPTAPSPSLPIAARQDVLVHPAGTPLFARDQRWLRLLRSLLARQAVGALPGSGTLELGATEMSAAAPVVPADVPLPPTAPKSESATRLTRRTAAATRLTLHGWLSSCLGHPRLAIDLIAGLSPTLLLSLAAGGRDHDRDGDRDVAEAGRDLGTLLRRLVGTVASWQVDNDRGCPPLVSLCTLAAAPDLVPSEAGPEAALARREVASCLASLCALPGCASFLATESGLCLRLRSLYWTGDSVTRAHVARAVANATGASYAARQALAGGDWLRDAAGWLGAHGSPEQVEVQLCGLITLVNSAVARESLPLVVETLMSDGVFSRLLSQGHPFQVQMARLAAALSADGRTAARFFESIDLAAMLHGLPLDDPLARQYAALCLANLSAYPAIGRRMLRTEEGRDFLLFLLDSDDEETQRTAARAIANLAVDDESAARLEAHEPLRQVLRRWEESGDAELAGHAARAHASLLATKVSGPKYEDGVYLLSMPPSVDGSDIPSEPLVDVVFVHGVAGDPLTTWRQRTAGSGILDAEPTPAPSPDKVVSADDTTPAAAAVASPDIWPRDWLGHDLPQARILSLGYRHFLSEWRGVESSPLPQRARQLAAKLRAAGVGKGRPVVFVTHSYGGLLVKEMVTENADLGAAVRGIVFFSTPHRGTTVAARVQMFGPLVRPHTESLSELLPGNDRLATLHEKFLSWLAKRPTVRTLTVVETLLTCGVPTKYNCYTVVTDSSARLFDDDGVAKPPASDSPFFGGSYRPRAVHEVVAAPLSDHGNVCKPESRDDPIYQQVKAFISWCVT